MYYISSFYGKIHQNILMQLFKQQPLCLQYNKHKKKTVNTI